MNGWRVVLSNPARWAAILCVVAFGLRPVLPPIMLCGIAALAIVISLAARAGPAGDRGVATLFGALALYAGLAGDWFVWPAYFLLPLLFAFGAASIAGFADAYRGLSAGRLGRGEIVSIVVIALLTLTALSTWVIAFRPDLSHARSMLPDWSPAGLVAAALVFSIGNAVLEEVIWRGVLLGWMCRFLSPVPAIGLQAISFGAAHYFGVPSGLVGVALATLYGLMLGWLAWRSQGLVAAIVAHVAADLCIVVIVAAGTGG